MKAFLALLLLGSVVANAVLWPRLRDSQSTARTTSPENASAARAGTRVGTVVEKPEAARQLPSTLRWAELPVHDLTLLKERLNELGLPAAAVRAVISALIRADYEPQLNALYSQQKPDSYWRMASLNGDELSIRVRSELRLLHREMNQKIRDLLGPMGNTTEGLQLVQLRQRYGNLPADTLLAVKAIDDDYSEMQRNIRGTGLTVLLPEDREMLALLEVEKRKDLLQVLTPEQYEERELRSSTTAASMRRSLVGMEPTEAEFRTVFRHQKQFDEKYGGNARPTTAAGRSEMQAAERAMVAAVKAELGEERGMEYEKSRDLSYGRNHVAAKQLGLPKEAGEALWKLQKDTFQQFNQLGANRELTPQQKHVQQLEIIRTAKTALTTQVGEANVETYQRAVGNWLQSIEQAANRNAPPPAR